MKKFLTIVVIALITLTSCSEENESTPINNVNTQVLVKKIITTVNDGEPITSLYTYNGDKLSTISYSDGRIANYSYNNQNVVTNITEYIGSELIKNENLTYHDYTPLLESITTTSYANNSESGKITLNKNTFDDIIVKSYEKNSQNQYTLVKEQVLLLNGTNISSLTTSDFVNETISYGYDGKNSPFRNMAGYKFMVMARLKGGVNNMLSYNRSGATSPESSTVQYTYNSDNFPTASTETKSNGDIITTQYFYE